MGRGFFGRDRSSAVRHSALHAFECASRALRQRKGCEHAAHVFDNGNERGAALRDFVSGEEDDSPAEVDGASVPARDQLVGEVSPQSVELLVMFIDDELPDRLPRQRIALRIIAQS
jgi:hypothetical protein